ncbi:MAG TPA: DUF4062 domain-containing protein [Pyrinomonadaceae bacterium]|nr:DUF4062 domain-containing protein [Pyrinomonadaceae bacterium]
MARIYVSSTSIDLEDHRKTVSQALRRLGHEDVAMDYYVAEDMRPVDRSLSDVASCDVYVGIFAYRYGYVPKENNPEGRSITELEYRKAQEVGIPCLIFLLSDEAPWPTNKREKGEGAQKIEALREELSGGGKHVVNFFGTADELARKVNEAVTKWATEKGLIAKRQLTDWDAYREAVIHKHQWVRLQVIAGASKDRGPVKIPLTEVFESQLATTGASGADVPEEVRKYQEIIYGPKPEAPVATAEAEEIEEAPDDEDPLLMGNPEQVLDLLGRERTQVILGGPGSGKSTILQYVMLRVCQIGAAREALPLHLQDAPLPFLIDLRNYVLQKAEDFSNYIVKNALDIYDSSIEIDNLISVLGEERQALVLFDGLDEVFDPDERRRVINQFQSFAHRYPHARIVVTSRIAGYDRTALGLAGFEHYTLLPLTLSQIRHFAEQWYEYYTLEETDRTAQGLIQRIIESPRLLDLAGNPLLLTMMAVIYKDRDLPNERWKLYERCAETLLEDWDLGKGIEDEDFKLSLPVRTAQKSEILQRVSMYMLEHEQKGRELNAIAYGPLLDVVATYFEEKYQKSRGEAEAISVDILRHLMERTYVLAGIGERIFGFVHRTFMEYFAACHCKEQFNKSKSDYNWLNNEIFGAHWNKSEWEEVLLLLIAMLHDQKTPIHEIIGHLQPKDYREQPLKLAFAGQCLGEAGDLQDQGQGSRVLRHLANAIFRYVVSKTIDLNTLLKAFASLAPLVTPTPDHVRTTIGFMDTSNLVASRMAAWQMGFALRTRKERLAYALMALNDPNEAVRRGAIAALEREWPGRADVGDALIEVVRSDRQARVRLAALSAMQRSWRSDPAILDAISSRIDDENGYRNVIKLVEYLAAAWRNNEKALDLVLTLAGPRPKARDSYDYDSVMSAVLPALSWGWTGNPKTLAFLQQQASTYSKPSIRSIALQEIAQRWSNKIGTLEFLQKRTEEDPDPQTRVVGLKVIQRHWAFDEDALSILQHAAVTDPEPVTRVTALELITHTWRSFNVLLFVEERANAETELKVKTAAFNAIASGWQNATHAFSFLLKWAKNSSDAQIRIAALEAIERGWRNTDKGFRFIKDRAVIDPDPKVREIGLRLMAGLRHKPNAALFIYSMGQVKETVSVLRERSRNEPDSAVRESIVELLQHFARLRSASLKPAVYETLMNLATNDSEPGIRLRALNEIARKDNRDLWTSTTLTFLRSQLPFLKRQATSNSEAPMRCLALEVIGSALFDDDSLRFLKEAAIKDTDPSVRSDALQIIDENSNQHTPKPTLP